MTYCVALNLKEGLIFISDTRTNAGVDHISIFRKMHIFGKENERFITLQTSGNLATSQAVLGHLRNEITLAKEPNIMTIPTLFEIAEHVGKTLKAVIQQVSSDPLDQGNYSSSILLGGQIITEKPKLYNIYPQGNFIQATTDTPFFQIGESKYGKPILDRALNYHTPLDEALRCSLISFDSTLRSNVSVGLPLDVVVYKSNSFKIPLGKRIYEHDPYFEIISQQWSDTLKKGLQAQPTPTDDYWE